MSKPVVFLSSTIYDFRDLRSALKYYFEQRGFEVIASENNDFVTRIDKHSYDNCLTAIEQRATHFVLLIGSRVGGWYEEDKVSITQKEYRVAYEKAKAGKLSILSFVRKDIWDVREDRKGLADLLSNEEMLLKETGIADLLKHPSFPNLKETIVNHPSRIINSAKFTFEFLAEVGRINETKAALATVADKTFPVSNWIFPFNAFADIIQTIEAHFQTSIPLERLALEGNLKNELFTNIAALSVKVKGGGIINRAFLPSKLLGSFDGTATGETTFSKIELATLFVHTSTELALPLRLQSFYLREALRSTHYLQYVLDIHDFSPTSMHVRLNELLNKIEDYPNKINMINQAREILTKELTASRNSSHITILNLFLGMLKGAVDEVNYLSRLMENISLQLITPSLSWTDLNIDPPPKPFRKEDSGDAVTFAEIQNSLNERAQRMLTILRAKQ